MMKIFIAEKEVSRYEGKDQWTEMSVNPIAISLSKESIEEMCENLYTGEEIEMEGRRFLEEFHIYEEECEINFPLKKGENVLCLVSRTWNEGFHDSYNDSYEPGWERINYLLFSMSQDELEAKKEEIVRERFSPILQEVSEEFEVEIPCPSIERQESILNSREDIRFSIKSIEVI